MNLRLSTALAIVLIAASHPVAAQSWPAKPIRAFIPFSAGIATDIVPRAVFEPLSAELGLCARSSCNSASIHCR